jgi:hypothetical protein
MPAGTTEYSRHHTVFSASWRRLRFALPQRGSAKAQFALGCALGGAVRPPLFGAFADRAQATAYWSAAAARGHNAAR